MPGELTAHEARRFGRRPLIGAVVAAVVVVVVIAVVATVVIMQRGDDDLTGITVTAPGDAAPQTTSIHVGTDVTYRQSTVKGLPSGASFRPVGVSVDAQGSLLIAEQGGGLYTETDGTWSSTQFPGGVRFGSNAGTDAAGNEYLADEGASGDDGGVGRVRMRTPAGVTTTLPFGRLGEVPRIAVGDNGTVYVADADRVLVLKPGARRPTQISTPNRAGATDVAVSGDGSQMVVTDASSWTVWRLHGIIPILQVQSNDIRNPTASAIDDSGNIYVVALQSPGFFVFPRGQTSPIEVPVTGLVRTTGIAVDSTGTVYISDMDQGVVVTMTQIHPQG